MQQLSISLKKLIADEQRWKITLLEKWPSIVNHYNMPMILLKIHSSAITIGVFHSILAQEVTFMVPTMKQEINTLLQTNRIQQIYTKIVPQPHKAKQDEIPKNLQNNTCKQYSLTIQEQAHLHELEESNLKEVMHKFLMRCKKVS